MNLRPYQSAASDAIFKEWLEHDPTLVVIPTGGGKTILFADVNVLRKYGYDAEMSFAEASATIDALARNGWQPKLGLRSSAAGPPGVSTPEKGSASWN